jgi:hypothetical protein
MNGSQQARVLLAQLVKGTGARGTTYLRGWAGASNLVGLRGEIAAQGRPTWQLSLVDRQARDARQGRQGHPGGQEARRLRRPIQVADGSRTRLCMLCRLKQSEE